MTIIVSTLWISGSSLLLTTCHVDISIDGDTAVAFTENVEQRFLSYGWQVLHVNDGDKSVII